MRHHLLHTGSALFTLAACGPVHATIDAASSTDAATDARVDAAQPTLTVMRTGAGTGKVSSVPPGIDCGVDCSEGFAAGTHIVLTATADPDSIFSGWSNGGCTGTGPCNLVMPAAAVTVSADFANSGYITQGAGWSCASSVSCQDVYDVTLPADTNVTLAVSDVTGHSVVRLAAFAPGMALTGVNLLSGQSQDRKCVGQDASDRVTFKAVTAGRYRIAVGRDWNTSAGANGTYTLAVSTNRSLTFEGQTAGDLASAAGTRCGYVVSMQGLWSCPTGVTCQDVADATVLSPSFVNVSVTDVTGNSVVRMAVFSGSDLDSTNLLNGHVADRRCGGQNASDSATTQFPVPAGLVRLAVGRDGTLSAGTGGSFIATVTTPDVPLVVAGATGINVATELPATSCP